MHIALAAVLGACVGSFLNVAALRLPKGERLDGRSRCPHCQVVIRWYQNVPLLSFVWLRGKCASCRGPIAWQYPAVETAGAVLFALAYARYGAIGDWITALAFASFASFAIAMFVTDLKYGVLPDQLTLGGTAVIAVLNLARGLAWWNIAASAVGAAAFFWLQILVSRGRWVGEGDVRLGAWLGAGLAWPGAFVALALAYMTGALVGITLIASGRAKWQSQIPFGTFLTASAVAAFLWGQELIDMYMAFINAV